MQKCNRENYGGLTELRVIKGERAKMLVNLFLAFVLFGFGIVRYNKLLFGKS